MFWTLPHCRIRQHWSRCHFLASWTASAAKHDRGELLSNRRGLCHGNLYWGWRRGGTPKSSNQLGFVHESAGVDTCSCAKNALTTFVYAHNTAYYVNSYTTMLDPTMDGVLQPLLDGVRRLQFYWQDKEEKDVLRLRNKKKVNR